MKFLLIVSTLASNNDFLASSKDGLRKLMYSYTTCVTDLECINVGKDACQMFNDGTFRCIDLLPANCAAVDVANCTNATTQSGVACEINVQSNSCVDKLCDISDPLIQEAVNRSDQFRDEFNAANGDPSVAESVAISLGNLYTSTATLRSTGCLNETLNGRSEITASWKRSILDGNGELVYGPRTCTKVDETTVKLSSSFESTFATGQIVEELWVKPWNAYAYAYDPMLLQNDEFTCEFRPANCAEVDVANCTTARTLEGVACGINDQGDSCVDVITGGENCIFPFWYRGEEYTSCTTKGWSDLHDVPFWCSTKVRGNGEHVTGHWENC
jgi:hypothetical protein